MPLLDLSPDELLTTTRSVRLRLDFERPVERSIVEECLRIAQQAPTGGNRQTWSFVVVTDPDQRRSLGRIYRRGWDAYLAELSEQAATATVGPVDDSIFRVYRSAQYLAERMGETPVLIVPCIMGRLEHRTIEQQAGAWGSILPAAWSLMLAARARGLGTCLTTVHLRFERDAASLLDIPYDDVTQAGLIPLAYTKGTRFGPAPRNPLEAMVHWDKW